MMVQQSMMILNIAGSIVQGLGGFYSRPDKYLNRPNHPPFSDERRTGAAFGMDSHD
jgi:hypothetical protein